MQPREYTGEEIREKFLQEIIASINYWDKEPSERTQTERLSGLAFSILNLIDSGGLVMPGFILAPIPQEEDKQYCIDKGQNYYPENNNSNVKGDIGGELHDIFMIMNRKA